MTNPAEHIQLREMVLAIIHHQQDYDKLLGFLEPVTRSGMPLNNDATMTLAMLISDVERQAMLNDQLHTMVKDELAPTLVLTETGVLLACNQAARDLFHSMDGDNYQRLGITAAEFEQFRQRLYRHNGPTLIKTWPAGNPDTPLIMTATCHAPYRVFVFQSLECRWPDSIEQALAEIFGLSTAEREILASLAQGLSAEQISEQRCRSLGTVRQQIKTVMQKMGANRQSQVVAAGAALANRTSGRSLGHEEPGLMSPWPLTLGDVVRNGRLIGWRRYGPASGTPVLLLHGPFFGAGDFEQDRALAHRFQFDVIIPERPGYGRTPPASPATDPLDNQVDDCMAILDQLGINKAWLLSHESGLIPAMALAQRYPQRFCGLLAVSPSGHFKPGIDLQGVPAQQRAMLWSARHAFWITRMLIRLSMVQVRKLGPDRWVEAIFADSPDDLEVLHAESARQGKLGTYHYNYNQNGAGLELDLQQTTTDWDQLVAKVNQPFCGILGTHNRTTPPRFVNTLKELNPRLKLEEIDAGQTLVISHAEHVFTRLAQMINQQQPATLIANV